jgi:hypothetical protein
MSVPAEFKAGCILTLLRGAARFHAASLQDANPIIAARHNGYAVALIDALADLATEEEVRQVAEMVSLRALRQEILRAQDKIEAFAFKIYADLKKKGVEIPGLSLQDGLRPVI